MSERGIEDGRPDIVRPDIRCLKCEKKPIARLQRIRSVDASRRLPSDRPGKPQRQLADLVVDRTCRSEVFARVNSAGQKRVGQVAD